MPSVKCPSTLQTTRYRPKSEKPNESVRFMTPDGLTAAGLFVNYNVDVFAKGV